MDTIKGKKSFYKIWWFWLIIVVIFIVGMFFIWGRNGISLKQLGTEPQDVTDLYRESKIESVPLPFAAEPESVERQVSGHPLVLEVERYRAHGFNFLEIKDWYENFMPKGQPFGGWLWEHKGNEIEKEKNTDPFVDRRYYRNVAGDKVLEVYLQGEHIPVIQIFIWDDSWIGLFD